MEDKLKIANRVNKKYKELMNELDNNIKEAIEELGTEEAEALLDNRLKAASAAEKCNWLICVIIYLLHLINYSPRILRH